MTPESAQESPLDPSDSLLPVGWLRPAHDRACRALTALDELRTRDALINIAAMPDQTLLDLAWRAYLGALAEMQRADHDRAEALFLQAHGAACICAAEPADHDSARHAPRMAAAASEQLGVVLRRREKLDAAATAHRAAWRIRERHGSPEELWETALSLGLVASLQKCHEAALQWLHRADAHAKAATIDRDRLRAVAATRRAALHAEAGNFSSALAAAQDARRHWRAHDPGVIDAVRADVYVARAIIRCAEHDSTECPSAPAALLTEAMELLNAARIELAAFGPDHAAEEQACGELLDFARHLEDDFRARREGCATVE